MIKSHSLEQFWQQILPSAAPLFSAEGSIQSWSPKADLDWIPSEVNLQSIFFQLSHAITGNSRGILTTNVRFLCKALDLPGTEPLSNIRNGSITFKTRQWGYRRPTLSQTVPGAGVPGPGADGRGPPRARHQCLLEIWRWIILSARKYACILRISADFAQGIQNVGRKPSVCNN